MAEEDEDVVLAGIHQNDNTLKKSSWHELKQFLARLLLQGELSWLFMVIKKMIQKNL